MAYRKEVCVFMRPRILSLAALAFIATATSAVAAPVYVSPRVEAGVVPTDTAVVAFSYDVRRVFPQVQTRFEKWRPKNTAAAGKIPVLPTWNDYTLLHARQLMDFRDAFRRAHSGEDEILKALTPQFDEVFKKHGENPPSPDVSDQLAIENPRQVWCQKVTIGLNKVITEYNNQGLGGKSPDDAYRILRARWLGQRNEALRIAANQAGGHPEINFMEGATNEGGLAMFDLPPGDWWIACESSGRSWYKPVRVTAKGGHVVLDPTEARNEDLDLASWTGN